MTAYVKSLYSDNPNRPHSVVAFMSDSVEVINADPAQQPATDLTTKLADDRTRIFADRLKTESDPAQFLVGLTTYNTQMSASDVEEYDTDEDAMEDAYRLAGQWSQIGDLRG